MTHQDGNPQSTPVRAQVIAETLLGVDWGSRRIGLAIKPAGQDWALPKAVLTPPNEHEAVNQLRSAITESGATGVVVGLPEHPDPTQCQVIKRFCRKVRRPLRGVRWFFVDERLTTEAADSISIDRPVPSKKPGKRPTDDLAAALILETFLQTCH